MNGYGYIAVRVITALLIIVLAASLVILDLHRLQTDPAIVHALLILVGLYVTLNTVHTVSGIIRSNGTGDRRQERE